MRRLLAVLTLLALTSCAARSSSLWVRIDKRMERLQAEREKVKRATDPVDRTKSDIKIAEILLAIVSDAVRTGDLEVVEQRIDEYIDAIKDAHQTMTKTGRDAHKKPKGFKDLEIALRRQVRQLEDIRGGLSFDQRESIDKAKTEASSIRDELLKALFGEQNAPSRKG